MQNTKSFSRKRVSYFEIILNPNLSDKEQFVEEFEDFYLD